MRISDWSSDVCSSDLNGDVIVTATGAGYVLIVDDDQRIRAMLARFLTDHGLRVSQAADGRQMFAICADARIDVIVLDIMMPGEDGLSLCRDRKRTRLNSSH